MVNRRTGRKEREKITKPIDIQIKRNERVKKGLSFHRKAPQDLLTVMTKKVLKKERFNASTVRNGVTMFMSPCIGKGNKIETMAKRKM